MVNFSILIYYYLKKKKRRTKSQRLLCPFSLLFAAVHFNHWFISLWCVCVLCVLYVDSVNPLLLLCFLLHSFFILPLSLCVRCVFLLCVCSSIPFPYLFNKRLFLTFWFFVSFVGVVHTHTNTRTHERQRWWDAMLKWMNVERENKRQPRADREKREKIPNKSERMRKMCGGMSERNREINVCEFDVRGRSRWRRVPFLRVTSWLGLGESMTHSINQMDRLCIVFAARHTSTRGDRTNRNGGPNEAHAHHDFQFSFSVSFSAPTSMLDGGMILWIFESVLSLTGCRQNGWSIAVVTDMFFFFFCETIYACINKTYICDATIVHGLPPRQR